MWGVESIIGELRCAAFWMGEDKEENKCVSLGFLWKQASRLR